MLTIQRPATPLDSGYPCTFLNLSESQPVMFGTEEVFPRPRRARIRPRRRFQRPKHRGVALRFRPSFPVTNPLSLVPVTHRSICMMFFGHSHVVPFIWHLETKCGIRTISFLSTSESKSVQELGLYPIEGSCA